MPASLPASDSRLAITTYTQKLAQSNQAFSAITDAFNAYLEGVKKNMAAALKTVGLDENSEMGKTAREYLQVVSNIVKAAVESIKQCFASIGRLLGINSNKPQLEGSKDKLAIEGSKPNEASNSGIMSKLANIASKFIGSAKQTAESFAAAVSHAVQDKKQEIAQQFNSVTQNIIKQMKSDVSSATQAFQQSIPAQQTTMRNASQNVNQKVEEVAKQTEHVLKIINPTIIINPAVNKTSSPIMSNIQDTSATPNQVPHFNRSKFNTYTSSSTSINRSSFSTPSSNTSNKESSATTAKLDEPNWNENPLYTPSDNEPKAAAKQEEFNWNENPLYTSPADKTVPTDTKPLESENILEDARSGLDLFNENPLYTPPTDAKPLDSEDILADARTGLDLFNEKQTVPTNATTNTAPTMSNMSTNSSGKADSESMPSMPSPASSTPDQPSSTPSPAQSPSIDVKL